MSCSNCSKNSSGLPKGCRSNGSCSTGGCSQKTTYDWLSNLDQHKRGNDVFEVSFKNGRKGFYFNDNKLVNTNDSDKLSSFYNFIFKPL